MIYNQRFIVTLFLIALQIFNCYTAFKQNAFFFFDPVSSTPCNEKNYWTPFDQSTTCFRFVSITPNDSTNNEKIKIMLDHNIGTSTYSDYKTVLKEKTSNWIRYKGNIDIIDEGTISKLMVYTEKPTLKTPVKPEYKIGHYCSNSDYIIKGKKVNEKGYWTKNLLSVNAVFAIDENGKNIVVHVSTILGIRPVLDIEKSLLVADSGVIDITNLIKKSSKIQYDHESKKYDGNVYKQLQGFTVTKDKLVFISSNNNNRASSVLYSYKLNDLNNLYKKEYNTFGHGNGMTYNSKLNKVLIAGPYEYEKVYLYNGNTLEKEKEYPKGDYPVYNAIGYDDNDDLYVGHYGKRIFLADTTKMSKLYEFGLAMYEAGQDLEYHNGYVFYCTSDLGAPSKYQTYSFYKKGDNIIYVYDMKLDENKNPTKNFGRLVARLYTTGIGELESVSFRDGYIYFGIAPHSLLGLGKSYVFYKTEYKVFEKEVKKLS